MARTKGERLAQFSNLLDDTGQNVVPTVATLGELQASTHSINTVVRTKGYYAAGDGGGAEYITVADGTFTNGVGGHSEGGSFVQGVGVQYEFLFSGTIDAEQFGAKGDDGTTNDTQRIQNAINFLESVPSGGEIKTNRLKRYSVTGLTGSSQKVIYNLNGALIPFGVTSNYLFVFLGSATERNADSGNSTWNSSAFIKTLRIDGMGVSRGAYLKYADQFSFENIFIERTKGNPLKLELLREGDFHNLSITQCDAKALSEPVLWFFDTATPIPASTPYPDASNNLRFHGLNLVHNNGVYMKFNNDTGTAGERQRNIDFFGAQVHHYDTQPRNYSPITLNDATPTLIRNESAYAVRFHGGNLRIPGNDPSITSGRIVDNATGGTFPSQGGYAAPVEDELIFIGTRLSTERSTVTVFTSTQASGYTRVCRSTHVAVANGATLVNQTGDTVRTDASVANVFTNTQQDLRLDTSNQLVLRNTGTYRLGAVGSEIDFIKYREHASEPTGATAGVYAASDGTSSTNGFGVSGRGLYRYNGTSWVLV